MPARRFNTWLLMIFALGLLARQAPIAYLSWGKLQRDVGVGVNRQLATNLIEHHGFYFREWDHFGPSSIQTPPYPLALATLFWVFGNAHPNAYFAALTINAVVGGLAAVVAALLARRLCGNDFAAVAAGILVALWPSQIFAATYVQPLAAVGMFVAVSCLLWRRAIERTSLGAWIGFSLAAAVAAMLEPRLLPAAGVALLAIAFVRAWPMDVRLRNAAVMLAVFSVLWMPWLARNSAVHGRVIVTTTFWRSVWAGANENATGSDRLPLTPDRKQHASVAGEIDADEAIRIPMMQTDALAPDQRAQLSRQPEAAREAVFRQWALSWIGEHPLQWVQSGGTRLLKAIFIDWDHPMSRHPAAITPRIVLGAATLAALVLLIRHRLPVAPELAVIFASIATQALSVATAKAAIAVEPIQIAVLIGVACAIVRATRVVTNAPGAPAALPVAASPIGQKGAA